MDSNGDLPPGAPEPAPGTVDKVMAAGLGTLIGMVVAGPVGAAIGAMSAPVAEGFMARVREEWQRRGEIVLSAAGSEACSSQEALFQRLADDDHLQALLTRIIMASTATAFERKLVGLGRVLGRATTGVLRIDEAVVLASALHDLEAPHVAMLERLNQPNPTAGENAEGWSRRQLVEAMPEAAHVVPNLVSVLERHGLAVDNRGGMTFIDDVRPFIATDLGRTCLDVLKVATETGFPGSGADPGLSVQTP